MTDLAIFLAGVLTALTISLLIARRDDVRRRNAAARRPIANRWATDHRDTFDGGRIW